MTILLNRQVNMPETDVTAFVPVLKNPKNSFQESWKKDSSPTAG